MEPCVFRMPFPPYFKGTDEATLLANVRLFFTRAVQEDIAPYPIPTPVPSTETIINTVMRRLLADFDFVPFSNPQQIRNFVTNHLLTMVANGKGEGSQLKAMELLGKIKDVGLFEERSTILVEHMTTDEIKSSLRNKVQRLREKTIDAETIETIPATANQGDTQ